MSSRRTENLPALVTRPFPFLRAPDLKRLRYRFRKAICALLPSRAGRRYLYTEIIESDKGADRIPVRRAYSMNLKALMANFTPEELHYMASRGEEPPPQLTITFCVAFRSHVIISGATGICSDEATGAALASTVRPALHLTHRRAEPAAEKLRPVKGESAAFYLPPPPPAPDAEERFRLFFCEYLPELHLCLTEALRKDTPACLVIRDDAAPFEEDVYAALTGRFPALTVHRLKETEALHAPKAALPCYDAKGKPRPYLSRGYRHFVNDILTAHFRLPPPAKHVNGLNKNGAPVLAQVQAAFASSSRRARDPFPPSPDDSVERFDFTKMSLSEIVQWMRLTARLEARHGAALTAALFLPEGAHVTEITSAEDSQITCDYLWMSKVFGLHHQIITEQEATHEPTPPETQTPTRHAESELAPATYPHEEATATSPETPAPVAEMQPSLADSPKNTTPQVDVALFSVTTGLDNLLTLESAFGRLLPAEPQPTAEAPVNNAVPTCMPEQTPLPAQPEPEALPVSQTPDQAAKAPDETAIDDPDGTTDDTHNETAVPEAEFHRAEALLPFPEFLSPAVPKPFIRIGVRRSARAAGPVRRRPTA